MKDMVVGLKLEISRVGCEALQFKEMHERGDGHTLLHWMRSDWVPAGGFTKHSLEARRDFDVFFAKGGGCRLECDVESVVGAKEHGSKVRSTIRGELQTMQQVSE